MDTNNVAAQAGDEPMRTAIEYVNKVAPEHDRKGCIESKPIITCRYEALDNGGCYRCTILRALQLATTKPGA